MLFTHKYNASIPITKLLGFFLVYFVLCKKISVNYLNVENISKAYGELVLFENLSFSIHKNQKIAFVAKNGSGKTTLLKVLAGEEAPEGEKAKIQFKKDIKIGFLKTLISHSKLFCRPYGRYSLQLDWTDSLGRKD